MARRAKEETEAANAFVRIEEAKQAILQGVYSYDGRKWKNGGELVTLIKNQAAAMLDNVQRYKPQVVPEDVEQIIARKDKTIKDLHKENERQQRNIKALKAQTLEALERIEEQNKEKAEAAANRQNADERLCKYINEIAAMQNELQEAKAELVRMKEKLNNVRDIQVPTLKSQFNDMVQALENYAHAQSAAQQRAANRLQIMREAAEGQP